ncbi:MAG TPA: NAD(P)/FAD-dependent oxidoreductase [Acidimicrobiales bacterium]|nr:NAD(P)/FAD-dependent oxidoreductase [Acidimicrobiales bacterium]
MPTTTTSDRARVLVLGAGFAGLSAVRHLVGTEMDVTIVDQHNFHTFQPLLYQVATAGLEPADVAYPVRTVFGRAPNVTFRHARVDAIDLAGRTVTTSEGDRLAYDALVVATGAVVAHFGVPGAAEHALPLYTLRDARRLRNRLLSVLEEADAHPERHDDGAPVFVVVGGGPTGVETAGALVELLEVVITRDRLRIDPTRSKVVLVDGADRLLGPFRPEASRYAADTLRSRRVDVRLGCQVASVDASSVTLADGTTLRADVVVWAAGVAVEPTAAGLGGTRGRVAVEPNLSLKAHPEVFVVGDAAAVPIGPGLGRCAQVAQVAIQSGRHAARELRRRANGEPARAFRYVDKGIMAAIGRRAAVAQLRVGPVIRGTLGWLAWLGLHLVYLIGFRNRLRVLVNWWWRYVDWPSGPRLIVADAESEP